MRERVCKACEGTGYNVARCLRAIQHDSDICNCLDHPCAACSGSGRVVESIPAADALADTEQLARFATFSDDFVDAGAFGGAAMRGVEDLSGCDCGICRRYIYNDAKMAARHAFYAVPGLRA